VNRTEIADSGVGRQICLSIYSTDPAVKRLCTDCVQLLWTTDRRHCVSERCNIGYIPALSIVSRHYFQSSSTSCTKTSDTVVTSLAAPLNYVGANPKVTCHVPQPTK
jgi:hypothetical protein